MGRNGEVTLGIVFVGVDTVIPVPDIEQRKAGEGRAFETAVGSPVREFRIAEPGQILVKQGIGTK